MTLDRSKKHIKIRLPDVSVREYPAPVSVAQVAQSIGAGLAKNTLAGKVNGQLVDACDLINHDATLSIITPKDEGYQEVNSPDMMDRKLWEISGHWQNYHDHMFTTQTEDNRTLALKPMNCPGSVLLYRHRLKSFRDLPIRMGEFGKVHRYEPSGSLHSLMRVRHYTQDDAHIYCTPAQMEAECRDVVSLVLDIYRQFGFDEVRIKLSTRPENRLQNPQTHLTTHSLLAGGWCERANVWQRHDS